jgi:hypothetical protein
MNNYPMNLFFGTVWLIMLIVIAAPEVVGEWQAKRDVAYDSIWGEYLMDCDCTENLEDSGI